MLLNQDLILILAGGVFVWLGALSFFLFRTVMHYRRLIAGAGKGDLVSILEKILKKEELTEKRIDEILKRVKSMEEEGRFHIQKTGLVRFNPFSDTGGSQSFSLAILDGGNSGIVISSLHSRDQTRIYTKPVKNGKPTVGFEFSKEEREAIEKAQRR